MQSLRRSHLDLYASSLRMLLKGAFVEDNSEIYRG